MLYAAMFNFVECALLFCHSSFNNTAGNLGNGNRFSPAVAAATDYAMLIKSSGPSVNSYPGGVSWRIMIDYLNSTLQNRITLDYEYDTRS